jgi:AraC family ethanolamine operon transcriptional activator
LRLTVYVIFAKARKFGKTDELATLCGPAPSILSSKAARLVPATFTIFEAYAEAIQDAELDVRLLYPYERCWSIEQQELGPLRVQHGIEGSGLLTRGAVKPEGWAFFVQRSGDPIPVNGQLLIGHSIAVLPPGGEFRFSGQGRTEWYSVYAPSVSLALPDHISGELSSAGVITVGGQLFGRIRSALEAAFNATASRSPATPSECCTIDIEQNLISAFHQILNGSIDSKCRLERSVDERRKSLISKVLELINDAGVWTMSVPELANEIGVSQRTLLTAFREQLGITPQSYLIAHRLHLARQSLMESATHRITVAAVAAKFGFFDLGRFAGRYFKMFGEHPSETLLR